MAQTDQPIMIYTTFASVEDAERAGEKIVTEKLAACVNILPAMVSIYRWRGEMINDREVVMLVKSRAAIEKELVERLKELHPYDTPVLFVIAGRSGADKFWHWLREQTGGGEEPLQD